MKLNLFQNLLFIYIYYFIQLIKLNYCKDVKLDYIEPSPVKINSDDKTFKSITLMFDEDIENDNNNKPNRKLTLKLFNSEKEIICNGADIEMQDKEEPKAIVFKLDVQQFFDSTQSFGKYIIYKIDGDIIKYEEKTVLIILNYINFKNPTKIYELTTSNTNNITIRYILKNEIEKDYINKIEYIDNENTNSPKLIKYDISDDKKNLIIDISPYSSPKNITFYIYPEYNKNIQSSDCQKLYLQFQDFILLTDAIYIRRYYLNNIYFRALLKNREDLDKFYISENSRDQTECELKCTNLECICNFQLIRNNPGKIEIEYIPKNKPSSITQKRDIFIILYESPISGCYLKNNSVELNITTTSNEEMEYQQALIFNGTARKSLSEYKLSLEGTIINLYKARSSSLNSGTYYIFSQIHDLNGNLNRKTNENPIDDNYLYFTIYPARDIFDDKNYTVFIHSKQDQNIIFTSTNVGALDEIVLINRKNTMLKIEITRAEDCLLSGESLTCNIQKKLYDKGNEYIGDYNVEYRSKCDRSGYFKIEPKIITIKRSYNIISLNPEYVYQDEIQGKKITLEYDNDLNNNNYIINFFYKLTIEQHFEDNVSDKAFVTVTIDKKLNLGIYTIKSKIGDDEMKLENVTLKVIKKINDFKFNHHYFVLHDDHEKNKLIITVNDTTGTFGCMIAERNENKNLTKVGNNCKTFYYYFNRTGEFYFNYYYNSTDFNLTIPIEDKIKVELTYKNYFDFYLIKNCYYYKKFDLSLLFFSKEPKYCIFLYNDNDKIVFNYSKDNILSSFSYENKKLINQEYYFIISEEVEDKEIYLYKSNNSIKFTDIKVPEYIIKPNKTILFSNLFCNLSESKIEIQKNQTSAIKIQFTDCQYNTGDKTLSCNINNNNFYSNNPFSNYIYYIDDREIRDNNNQTMFTYFSNKLSDSLFKIEHDYDSSFSHIIVKIINKSRDFYFKLLSELGYYRIINSKNDSKIVKLYRNQYQDEFEINETEFTINFQLDNENFDLDINYLKRKNETWEGDVGYSIYHYFNNSEDHIINNSLFQITPPILIYNNKTIIKDLLVRISVSNFNSNIKFENLACSESGSNRLYICLIDTSKISKKSERFPIKVQNYDSHIDLIYYDLDSNSKKCKTLNNEIGDLSLIIDVPDKLYVDLINLYSESLITIGEPKKSELQLNYSIKGEELNLQESSFTIEILGNLKKFSLQEIGLNVIPTYNIRLLTSEKTVSLLPSKNQYLIVYLLNQGYINVNLSNIQNFNINGHNCTTLERNSQSNSINITFDLEWAKDEKDLKLYYVDICGTQTYTGINISIASFSLARNYFVLNNNVENMRTQRLIIKGPVSSFTRVMAYRDNGEIYTLNNEKGYYYRDFDQNSIGEYTFKIYNNDKLLSDIDEKVYVVNNLEDLLKPNYYPKCLFLDNNKEYLRNISYYIKSQYSDKIKNISIFKSKYKINDEYFNFTEKIASKDELSFDLKLSDDLKNRISTNTEGQIYLIEKDDKEQPIYVFKFKYTNITLNSIYSDIIYTDAGYIFFDMSCEIDNIDSFYLQSENKEINKLLKCDNSLYDNIKKVYNCSLSKIDSNSNPLLQYGQKIFMYGNYFITYSSNNYQICKKPFNLSYEIENADFAMIKDEQIDIDEYTTVKMNLNNNKKIFYLQNIRSVSYNDSLTPNENPINTEFKYVFNDTSKYLEFNIMIRLGHKYIINNICRKPCNYCFRNDCWYNSNNYYVSSNTKNINFTLNRKYIALYNSTDNKGNPNKKFKIAVGGQDKDRLEQLIIIFISDKGDTEKDYKDKKDLYEIEVTKTGRYEFMYKVEDEEEEFKIKNKYVLVANYDYEIFNLTHLNKKCLYYSNNLGLVTSLIPNSSYKFKEYVFDSDMNLILGNYEFHYSENVFKTNEKNFNLGKYKVILQEINRPEFYFTTINDEISVTSFDLEESFFYKDNIVTTNQICKLDNIFIREQNSEGQYYPLDCEYDNSTNKYYCETNYIFTKTKSNIFAFFIGNIREDLFLPLGQTKSIYNAIKDSKFRLDFSQNILIISSNNFDMNYISEIKINEEPRTSFKIQNTESIQLNYEKNNNFLSHVKELIRKEHKNDREKTIKNKKVNLEIVEKKCDEYKVNYEGACITCDIYADISYENTGKIWFEDGECRESCKNEEGYYIFNKLKHICKICNETTKIEGVLICGCLQGTVKSFMDDICYLPDSDEIKDLLAIKSNAQCYHLDGTTHNYCNHENTDKCISEDVSGYYFPSCICKEGHTGKYCEEKEKNVDLSKKMKEIFSENNNTINDGNIEIISYIRAVIYFLEKNQGINNIISYMDHYIDASINTLNNIINNNKNSTSQIYDVLELALYFLKYKINHSGSRRNLQEKENLAHILQYLHYANINGNNEINQRQGYIIQRDKLNLSSFICYKKGILKSEDFKKAMGNTSFFKIMEYIDIETDDDDFIYVTLINNSLFENNDTFDVRAYITTDKYKKITKTDFEKKNITFYVSSSDIHFNFDLAQYYENKKIFIYNKKDQAFTDPCYLSKEFDFDLTQKYRKNNVFQKVYYGNDNCIYKTFDAKINRLEFDCDKFNDFGNITTNATNISYGLLYINVKNDFIEDANKVYNLPIKCTKNIDNIGNNMAFWLFFIICIIEILYIIGINILTLGSLKKISFVKGLKHDELYYHIPREENEEDEDKDSNDYQMSYKEKKPKSEKTSTYYIDNSARSVKSEQSGIDHFYKSFLECLIINFKELHPIATLCHASLISPLILHSWLFVFNTLILFGFNALLYYESLIEKRIYDKKRNYFDYPMRKEFHKIILSILCQIVFTTLIKLLILVRVSQRENLKNSLMKYKLKSHEIINNDIVVRIEQFQDEMLIRRLIGGAIMVIGIVFFFYYSVAFCGVYINTQKNWFYSGVWSLFWNWIIFAPIYIVIISYLEYKKENSYNPLVYTLKRLFFF